MKRRCKLCLAAILFSVLTIIMMAFVLFVYDNDINIKNDEQKTKVTDQELDKNEYKKMSEQNKNDSNEKTREETSWSLLFEKYKGKEITKINTDKKIAALTFDAGANANGVEKTLEILKKENIKGTFFLTGRFIEKYPEKVQKIIKSEGDIGNHSYSHPYFTQISEEEILNELEKTEKEIAGFNMNFEPFFRFPYGDRNVQTREIINSKNYIDIRWTIDSLGWKGTSGGMTKELVENRVIFKVSPGAIIMMHLGSNPNDKSHLDSEALPKIISELKKQNYEFVTISELLSL